jgi:phage-related protein
MPRTRLIFFMEDNGAVPVRDWLLNLRRRQRQVFAKCVVRIRRLVGLGYELRRPEADLLRDGIYELRIRHGRVHYRILYFFHGHNIAILTHGFTKEGKVPRSEIDRALRCKAAFESNSARHSYEEDIPDG